MFKFHNDSMVNESRIVVLPGLIWVYAGKREGFGEEKGKMNLRGRESLDTSHKYKNWPNMSLFIARVLSAYCLLYFLYFIIL